MQGQQQLLAGILHSLLKETVWFTVDEHPKPK
jgi:hypothetical protein